jgi:glycosyltransferase involved in cell wall biosynthesis
MVHNLRIGIPMIGGKKWIGGIYYIEALIKAVKSLPEKEQPQVFLVIAESNLEDSNLHQEILSWVDGVFFLGKTGKHVEKILPKSFRCFSSQRELFKEIDFYFPVNADVLPEYCSASWFPDFQHVYLPDFFSPEEREGRNRSCRLLADQARLVVFSSKDAEKDFKNFFPAKNAVTRVLPFHSLLINELNINDPVNVQKKYSLPDRFLICCNQFWIHKNHIRLFGALAILRQEGINLHLVCTGSVEDYRAAEYFPHLQEQIAEWGLTNSIHILGHIPRNDQIQLIRRALAVIQPSLFEGWSTIVEDTRSLGKTIILSDLPVHFEQAPNHATYFNRFDATDLAIKLSQVIPMCLPGPDISHEQQAVIESKKLVQSFGRHFCSIASEAQFLFKNRFRGINSTLWRLLTENQ